MAELGCGVRGSEEVAKVRSKDVISPALAGLFAMGALPATQSRAFPSLLPRPLLPPPRLSLSVLPANVAS